MRRAAPPRAWWDLPLDPFVALDAAGDRATRRAGAVDGLIPEKCGLTALVPYYRPATLAVADAIKGLAAKRSYVLANHGRWYGGHAGEARCSESEEPRIRITQTYFGVLAATAGLNPRYLTPAKIAD